MQNNEFEKWKKLVEKELKDKKFEEHFFQSQENIKYETLYTEDDLKKINFKQSFSGMPPYLRGPKATMYTEHPWTIRQYAGFSTAEESNKFYKKCLAQGQMGLSVAFDLPTHRGYDSDHPRVAGDVGKAGVAIDSVEDMKILFRDIPLDKMSVSMTMNGAVLPILAAFIVAAEESGVKRSVLRGTIQNDILKEFMVRNTFIYPPKPSMRMVGDIISFTAKEMPNFNSISISGYHIQEAGGNSALELAFTLADGLEYVEEALKRKLDIDLFAPRLSFFFGIGMNFFMEIAKLRAARVLWCEIMSQFNPKNEKSLMLRTHCQTSGYTLTEQDPYNNIVRTTLEALSAVLGGTQSLHTNSFDEALALPSETSSRVARNTQIIIQEETDITKTVDPLGGSYFIESLTHDLILKVKEYLAEIKSHGGMAKYIEKGIAKQKVEESSAEKQARIDGGEDIIVGVNKYKVEQEEKLELLEVDNKKVLATQIKRLKQVKKSRDQKKVDEILGKLERAASQEGVNLLELTIEAMKRRATLGEVSLAFEKKFGRYELNNKIVSKKYSANFKDEKKISDLRKLSEKFNQKNGRRPRILVAKVGQDGHDRGAHVIASGLSDLGFDVDIGPLFQMPEEIVKQAIENDVHVIGISSLAGGHKVLVPEVIKILKKERASDIKVIVGGVIPPQDYNFLKKAGVIEIFGPGSSILESAERILKILAK